jgi:RNA polymerase sigma factor (sigma-70 family)
VEPSDAQLLVRTCRGDETAARLVWLRHSGPLLAYARTVLGSSQQHHADDAVQSVMIAILKASPRKLAKIADGRLWLATLTRRHCLNILRSVGREGRRRRGAASIVVGIMAEQIQTQTHASTDIAPALAVAMDRLPRRLREVIVLKHISQLTFDQIALSLDRNRSTLASQYQLAMGRLKELLKEQDRTISRMGETGLQIEGLVAGTAELSATSEHSQTRPSLGART